ncbi:MAG: hypothetical protein ACKO0Z_25275 [Betaproteobacteria bacterium]
MDTFTEQAPKLNESVIAQWRQDLLDRSMGIRFNADYSCVLDEDGTIMGDAAMFLVYRYAEMNEDKDIFIWYERASENLPGMKDLAAGYHDSEIIVTYFTGIPLEDACKLLWPTVLINQEYDLSKLTAKDFVSVLDVYLETGIVDWGVIT